MWIKEGLEMEKTAKTSSNRNMHAIILGFLGIILVIVGAYIINVHGAPLRGSGAGTLLFLLGVILLIIAVLRFVYKRH
jgi:Mg2+ and Co2+ transporter CorA